MGIIITILLALLGNFTNIVDPTGGNFTSQQRIVDPTGGNCTALDNSTTVNLNTIVDPTGGN